MKALTLVQPWAWAVIHAGKDVENRTWRPPESLLGQRFAIHAGKGWDEDGYRWLLDRGLHPPSRDRITRGAVVGSAVLSGIIEGGTVVRGVVRPGRRDGLAMEAACCHVDLGGWYASRVGWILRDVVALQVVEDCRGYQGLWPLPPGLASMVEADSVGDGVGRRLEVGR